MTVLAGSNATAARHARNAIFRSSPRLLLALLPLLAGCVSSLAPLGDDSLSLAGPAEQTIAIEAAGIETGPADAAVEPAASPVAARGPAEESEAVEAVLVAAVPEPAPRDRAGNPQIEDGIALAFAEADAPAHTGAIVPVAAPQPADPTAAQAQPKPTLFEVLFQRQQTRDRQRPARVASLGPVAIDEPQTARDRRDDERLPGVRSMRQLFGDLDEDHAEEAEADYRVAAVGAYGRLAPGGLLVQTDKVEVGCLKPELVALIAQVERRYGVKPVVTSGYRSAGRNQRAGGARQSLHMACMAADIQVDGVSKWDLAKYLRTLPGRGGVGTYCRTRSVHIDIGEQRDWHYPCRRLVRLKS